MEDLITSISLSDVVGLFLLLSSIWLIKIVLRRENENLMRGLVVFLLFLAVFLYLNQSPTRKWTVSDLKDRFFPQSIPPIHYRMETGTLENFEYVKYIFSDPLPPVSLSMTGSGRTFRINNLGPVNRVLRHLKLPEINRGTMEQAALTGSRMDARIYRWEDYPRGLMILEETLIQQRSSLKTYHGIVQITIRKRY
jgi:hypothetical protein